MVADLIAITSVSARCAGADNVNEYWRLLGTAIPQFRAVPRNRWSWRETDRFPGRDNQSYSHTMAPIANPFEFDATRFGIPKARAKRMDPQQRMAINLVDDLIDRNSISDQSLKDRRVATIIGVSSTDYRSISTSPVVSELLVDGTLGTGSPAVQRIFRNAANAAVQSMSGHTMPGVLANMIPAAVQSAFNFNGPAFSVDSACASGLTAIEMACAMLQGRRIRACIAGGVYITLTPEAHIGFSAIGALSRTGECRPFTSAANGFVIGEGGAMILLKRLEDALEDGDKILGVIRALGSSNDGRAEGVMTPTVIGQINAIKEAAWSSDGLSLEVDAIEGHGTGTIVGDRTELETIQQAYAVRTSKQPIHLGSIKAVIGHTMAASGSLAVVKAVLSIVHNPTVIFLSGSTKDELQLRAAELRSHIKNLPEVITENPKEAVNWLNNAAAKLALRDIHSHRAAIIPDDIIDLDLCLQQIISGEVTDQSLDSSHHFAVSYVPKSTRVLFLYPGQGSQQVGEYSSLAAVDEKFRNRIMELEKEFDEPKLSSFLSQAWLAEETAYEPTGINVSHTAVAQPLLTVIAIAVTEALGRFGVYPTTTLGHSVGEFGALYGAGLFETNIVLMLIRERVRCMSRNEGGSMIAIRGSMDKLQSMIREFPGIYIACDNSPEQVVIGGDDGDLSTFEKELTAQDIAYSRLTTTAAFHTPYFAEADEEFSNIVHNYNWSNSTTHDSAICVSSVSAHPVEHQRDAANLISKQLAGMVKFREASQVAQRYSPHVVVQISGGDSLIRMYRQTNPEFTGMEIALGGQYDTPFGLSNAIARFFLSVSDFQPHLLISNGGVASMSWDQSWTSQNSVVNKVAKAVTESDTIGADYLRETELSKFHISTEGSSTSSVSSNNSMLSQFNTESSLPNQVLNLFHEQITVLSSLVDRDRNRGERLRTFETMTSSTPKDAAAPVLLDRDSIASHVKTVVAEVGGYKVEEVREDAVISSDLGFDSLMFTNIVAQINKRLPTWTPDEKRLGTVNSIADLIDIITEQLGVSSIKQITDGTFSDSDNIVGETYVDIEKCRICKIPEVLETAQKLDDVETEMGIPYYVEHESVASSTTTIAGRELMSYSSYNYLGLAGHPHVIEAVHTAVNQYGTSASAARILSGNRPLHTELENSIASLVGTEDAVVLIGGHSTNASVIPHLYNSQDLILHDALVHDSIHQGINASGATRHSFAHNNAANLAKALEARRQSFRRALIVTEGIFSMDGDIADLPRLLEVARKYDAHIMVDEAHSIGVLGKHGGGICEELRIDPSEVDILMGTLSKSLASCGGYIAGHKASVQYLRYTLSSLVFSAGLTPANTAASVHAIKMMRDEPERLQNLRENSRYFLAGAQARGLNTGTAVYGIPVIPIILGDSAITIQIAQILNKEGISVNPIIYPAVANSLARLRFFITSEHTEQQLDKTLDHVVHAVNIARTRQIN